MLLTRSMLLRRSMSVVRAFVAKVDEGNSDRQHGQADHLSSAELPLKVNGAESSRGKNLHLIGHLQDEWDLSNRSQERR
jgi:hypothetical protein